MRRSRDVLVSTAVLRERRAKLRELIAEQRRLRSDDDPFFKHTDWVLTEWEQAERDAAKEYVPTGRAVELTGWSEKTLRKNAQRARAGEAMPEGWEDLQVRREGNDWVFCVSTIPVKNTEAVRGT